MKRYVHLDINGYVRAWSIGDVTPEPVESGFVVQEVFLDPPTQPAGAYFMLHVDRWQWEDIRPLAQHKLDKWAEIKAQRAAREYGTFTASTGQTIDIDQASQIRIQSAYALAVDAKAAAQPFSIEWTLTNDNVLTLNANQMISLGKQVYAYINDLHTTARTLRNQILAATTVAEVDAVVWP